MDIPISIEISKLPKQVITEILPQKKDDTGGKGQKSEKLEKFIDFFYSKEFLEKYFTILEP